MADVALAKRIQEGREKILSEVRKIIIGQDEAVEHVLLTLLVEPELHPVVSREDMIAFQDLVRRVPVAEPVMRYAVGLVRASRPNPNGGLDFRLHTGPACGRHST